MHTAIPARAVSCPSLRRTWASDHAGRTGGTLDARATDRRPTRGLDRASDRHLPVAARCRRAGAGGNRHAPLRRRPADPGRTALSLAGGGRGTDGLVRGRAAVSRHWARAVERAARLRAGYL